MVSLYFLNVFSYRFFSDKYHHWYPWSPKMETVLTSHLQSLFLTVCFSPIFFFMSFGVLPTCVQSLKTAVPYWMSPSVFTGINKPLPSFLMIFSKTYLTTHSQLQFLMLCYLQKINWHPHTAFSLCLHFARFYSSLLIYKGWLVLWSH